jgi:hypothetical protein
MGKRNNNNELRDDIDYFRDVHKRKYGEAVGSVLDRKEDHVQEKPEHDPFVKIICSVTFVVIGSNVWDFLYL